MDRFGQLRQARKEEQLHTTKAYVTAANTGIRTARAEFVTYLLLLAYIAIAAATTTHRQLLLSAALKLPLLDVSVPMTAFYVIAPLLVVILHFEILWRSTVVAGRIRSVYRVARDLSPNDSDASLAQLELALIPVSVAESRETAIRVLIGIVAWMLGLIGPLFVLLSIQIVFLPYHSELITWWHRALIICDVAASITFWPTLSTKAAEGIGPHANPVTGRNPFERFRQFLESFNFHRFGAVSLGIVVVAFSIGVCTFPVEGLEVWLVRHSPRYWLVDRPGIVGQAQMLMPTCLLFERELCKDAATAWPVPRLHRNLVIINDLIVSGDPPPEIAARLYRRVYDEVAQFVPVDLRGRDLNFARLDASYLPHAIGDSETRIEGASLRHADFRGASFPGTRFRYSDLSAADFTRSNLNHADFNYSSLTNAIFDDCVAQNARFVRATNERGQGPRFRRCLLEFVRFDQSSMPSADFSLANLHGAKFFESSMQEAKFDASILTSIEAAGADFEYATFRLTEWDDGIQFIDTTRASLIGTRLDRADLRGADFTHVSAAGATFTDALMSYAKTETTDFDGARMVGTQVSTDTINGASLSLRETRLEPNFISFGNSGALEGLDDDLLKSLKDREQAVLDRQNKEHGATRMDENAKSRPLLVLLTRLEANSDFDHTDLRAVRLAVQRKPQYSRECFSPSEQMFGCAIGSGREYAVVFGAWLGARICSAGRSAFFGLTLHTARDYLGPIELGAPVEERQAFITALFKSLDNQTCFKSLTDQDFKDLILQAALSIESERGVFGNETPPPVDDMADYKMFVANVWNRRDGKR